MLSNHSTPPIATLAVCLLLVVGTVPVGAAQTDAETADEFLAELRQYEDSPALSTYSEFEVMRGQAVTDVQTGEFTEADRERMAAVVAVLDEFTAAYGAAQNESSSESLDRADATAEAIDQLEAAGGDNYATLARLGLERFYRQRGEALYERSREATDTSAELVALESAAAAFEAAGASDRYSTVSAEASRVRAIYESDRERMESAMSAAGTFVDDCGDACGSPVAAITALGPGVFGTYTDARSANSDAAVAVQLAEKHGLDAESERANTLATATSDALFSLSVAATILALVYALLVGLVAAAFGWRIATWAEDVDGSKVGRIVPRDPVEVSGQ
ncbi:hypothetical protein [Halobaculum magnesiiphilum]|uniref:Uncharacterized protein n=1 Tax=Halobaculum magnesiiphilum TaxID=1017351 RepID=A0A8T8WHW9_9EURY|nr:hypothetical protein [Halobaculum magnesiiphilum]QZP39462.1 hypothetical protein K6T50_17930 [Halobaculum magnesiiphilum]